MSSFVAGKLFEPFSGLGMATSGEGSVQPTVEESSKDTPGSTAETEQQKDTGKDEATPKATGEAAAGDATAKKKDDRRSRTKSPSPEPELGKRSMHTRVNTSYRPQLSGYY